MPKYSNSSLVNYTFLVKNFTEGRVNNTLNPGGIIDKITIHHMAGKLSVETCGNLFNGAREASSNYAIGPDGRIAMYVEEKNRAWTSSSRENDLHAVTIEVANDTIGGDWHVSDLCMEKLIALCIDICKRNDIKEINFTGDKSGNLTMHKYFAATACPGPYLESKFPWIAEQINAAIVAKPEPTPAPATPEPTPTPEAPKTESVRNLRKGDKGEDVRALQKSLVKLGYNLGTFGPDKDGADGDFGGATDKAVREFQRDNGLEVDGIVGPKTYAALATAKPKSATSTTFNIGDKVKLTSDAKKWANGKTISSWVPLRTLYVRSAVNSNGVCVVSTLRTGDVTGSIEVKYLKKI